MKNDKSGSGQQDQTQKGGNTQQGTQKGQQFDQGQQGDQQLDKDGNPIQGNQGIGKGSNQDAINTDT